MQIRFLGCHHTETSNTRLSSLLVDKELVIDAGAITSTLTAEEQSQIKAVLLTHQHLDHVRDVPTLALNGRDSGNTLPVFATPETLRSVKDHLLNSSIYPDFTQIPSAEEPRIQLVPLEPQEEREVCGYLVTPVPMIHCEGSVGYLVKSPSGERFFHSGDTNGEGLADIFQKLKPDLVVVEVTFPDSQEPLARLTNHLTPQLLGTEITKALNSDGEAPRFFVTHMNTLLEAEIQAELHILSKKLQIPITLAYEGLTLKV
ncbi:MAG: MBL fold metallo-hydrolase [Dehalococcoidia bacterium]